MRKHSKNHSFALLALLAFLAFPSHAQTEQKSSSKGFAVIELFTSQGDINSTPAEKILSNIIAEAKKTNNPVYCIAHHVDFWNRFGWKDPFSDFRSTNRLQNYSSALKLKETYTPFMIINGKQVVPADNVKKVNETIQVEISKSARYSPSFTWEIFDDTLDVSYKLNPAVQGKKISGNEYLVISILEDSLITKVTKGDNAGNTLRNDGIVRLWHTIDLKKPEDVVRIPVKKLKPGDRKRIMIFIQDKTSRTILGVGETTFSK